jgi:hypothetical protein
MRYLFVHFQCRVLDRLDQGKYIVVRSKSPIRSLRYVLSDFARYLCALGKLGMPPGLESQELECAKATLIPPDLYEKLFFRVCRRAVKHSLLN